ncbi:MAG: transglutaminase domain-containing protein [Candidatus Zixiibacteriota bacterium]|nr:MAG: transglutaminase domain-containing protein [candidate division Zixibacteria bacterium]
MRFLTTILSLGLLLLTPLTSQQEQTGDSRDLYYAIEQNDVICGYAHVFVKQAEFNGRPIIQLIDSVWTQLRLMGKTIDGRFRFEYHIDAGTGRYFYHSSDIDHGGMTMSATMLVVGDSVRIVSGDTTAVYLPPGTVLQNTRVHRYLADDFAADDLNEKTYQVFSEADGMLNTVTYTRLGREMLEMVGKPYEALKLRMLNQTTGIDAEMWIDAESGLLLKAHSAIRDIYLTGSGVVKKVKAANLDEKIFARVGVVIPNPWAISYMKVKARLKPAGMWITPESLNVPGQKFDGTVEENLVQGVFDVKRDRYDGSGAPPFPCDFSGDTALKPYLEPGDMIESEAPMLVEKAAEITAGAADAWDAAIRLSRWVNDEIDYDLPGGGTALNTFKTRLGECGSHANLLAAFCRAVGIPCRTVFGCMYVPSQGGAFGQHAWNEIYMGKAGWIPVDATVEEIDYADCAHIRLGEWKSKAAMFNPDTMEILDYRVGEGPYADAQRRLSEEIYKPYVGQYRGQQGTLTVLVQNGSLAVDIPGQMVFELKDPNEHGDWFFKLTNQASVSFETDSSGQIVTMVIDQRQRLPRKSEGDSSVIHADIPHEYRACVGAYTIPMRNALYAIVYQDSGLALDIPNDRVLPLQQEVEGGRWMGDYSPRIRLAISFETEAGDVASSMTLSQLVRCPRITSPDEN